MPSAANVKLDKQVSSENALADSPGNCNPLRQAITVMEHKIRNLEKRKSKLESYRDLQNAGKELNADQKTAVAKYNEVIHTIEFAKDMCKQFLGIALVSEKEAKKQAKKELAAKTQADLARLREILLVQDALNQMGTETVREDFLYGRNGAAQLTETDLKLLDDLYPVVTPKHEVGNPTAFTNEVQTAAEHLLAVVDGKQKEIFGGTYSQIKEVLGKIHESGYFDQAQSYEGFVANNEQIEQIDSNLNLDNNTQQIEQQPPQQQIPPIDVLSPLEVLPAAILTQPQPPLEQQLDQNLQPEQPPLFFQQQQIPQPPPQQQPQPPRPITEMLGTGSFFFLQESEIDTPPEQIPSQTFTNQSFVGGPPPPQPIPIPALYQNIPTNIPSQATIQQTGNPVNTTSPTTNNNSSNNNGIDDTQKQLGDESSHLTNNNNHKQGGGNRPSKTNSNQSYYQNNGYNNNSSRPRQSRNGPRSGTRHNN